MDTPDTITFSSEERERYSRQISLPELGEEGQKKLKAACVAVIGAGGLGSPVLLYLAAAGVGHITVVDADTVSLSNLQRQVIHDMTRLGDPKVESAVGRMLDINPSVKYRSVGRMLTPDNVDDTLRGADFVIDATDNYETKMLLSDACSRLGLPLCYGGISMFQGQLLTQAPGRPTLHHLFETAPRKPAPGDTPRGPLGVVAGVIGALQATEAIKWITGIGKPLTDTLLRYNALTLSFHKIKLA